MESATPLCPTCGQPASQALAGPSDAWECRNEACTEFGQIIDPDLDDPDQLDEPPAPR